MKQVENPDMRTGFLFLKEVHFIEGIRKKYHLENHRHNSIIRLFFNIK